MPRVVAQKIGQDHHGRTVFAPIVTITIQIGPCIATRLAFIDSGADSTIVPIEFLTACKVDYKGLSGIASGAGAGGSFETRLLPATVKFREWVICDEIKVAAPGTLPVALLGRSDFFAKFNVRFRWDMSPPVVDVDPLAKTNSPPT